MRTSPHVSTVSRHSHRSGYVFSAAPLVRKKLWIFYVHNNGAPTQSISQLGVLALIAVHCFKSSLSKRLIPPPNPRHCSTTAYIATAHVHVHGMRNISRVPLNQPDLLPTSGYGPAIKHTSTFEFFTVKKILLSEMFAIFIFVDS